MASYVHLNLDQGADFSYTLVLNSASNSANLDITNYTITSQMRKSVHSANATANLTCTKLDSTNGAFSISMPGGTTANISSGRYVFDVVYTDTGDGSITRALEGTISVLPRVTR